MRHLFLPAVLLFILLAGCQKQKVAPMNVDPDHVNYLDKAIQKDLTTENASLLPASGNKAKVQVVMRNTDDEPYKVECRTYFIGIYGEVVDGPTAWQLVYIPAQGAGTYSCTSLRDLSHISNYNVEVREVP